MRKIKPSEIGKVCQLLTDIFADYEAYRLFFPDEKRLARGIEAFFRYEIYASQEYTWVSDDFLSVAAVKCPGDKDRDPKLQFLNPVWQASIYALLKRSRRSITIPTATATSRTSASLPRRADRADSAS